MRLVGAPAKAIGVTIVLCLVPGLGLMSAQGQARGHDVTILNYSFDPAALAVDVGDTITWTNQDFVPHDIVYGSGPASIPLNSGSPCGMGRTASYTYTVGAIASGDYTYYCRCHGAATMSGTFSVANVAPTVQDVSASTPEDTTLTATFAGEDGNNEALSYAIVDAPTHGVATWTSGDSFTYVPDADFSGTDSFTYRASDGQSDSGVATVALTISAVNDPPVALPFDFSVDEDSVLSAAVSATDPEGDTLAYRASSDPAQGTVSFQPDGTFTFAPPADFSGTVAFGYRASDGELESNEATITVTVRSINDAPQVSAMTLSLNEDTGVNGRLPATDAEGDPLSFVLVEGPRHGTATVGDGGDFSYLPDANFHGADRFTYEVSDGTDAVIGEVGLQVAPVNDPPTVEDLDLETPESTPVSATVTATDVDGDELLFTLLDSPARGTVTLDASSGAFTYTPEEGVAGVDSFTFQASDGDLTSAPGLVSIDVAPVNDAPVVADLDFETSEDAVLEAALSGMDPDGDDIQFAMLQGPAYGELALDSSGAFTYTPEANFHGTDSFTFRASDGQAESGAATATIVVAPVNDAPTAEALQLDTQEDTPIAGLLVGQDLDGDALSYAVVDPPSRGQVTLDPLTGEFTYVPEPNVHGDDGFTFRTSDGQADSALATATVRIAPVNDPPAAASGHATTDEDVPLVASLVGTDVDGDPLRFEITSAPTRGTITLDAASGSYVYTPNADLHGPDGFTYVVADAESVSQAATISIQVQPVNDAPTAAPTALDSVEDTQLNGRVHGADVDGDVLTYVVDEGPAHGSLSLAQDGTFTYTPNSNYYGPDGFTFRSSDGRLQSDPARIDVEVAPVNDAPVAFEGSIDAPRIYPFSREGQLRATDIEADPLTFEIVEAPAYGTVDLDPTTGRFRYTPPLLPTLAQEDPFTFKVNDGTLDSNTATFRVRINALL